MKNMIRQLIMASAARYLASLGAITLIAVALVQIIALAEQPPTGRAQPADEAAAAKALGQPLPAPPFGPPGFARTELTIVPADPDIRAPAMVNQAFGIGGENMALLTVFKGELKLDIPGAIDTTIDLHGVTAGITVRTLPDGSTSVGYRWANHGLVYNLHIGLLQGVDRALADTIAASIP